MSRSIYSQCLFRALAVGISLSLSCLAAQAQGGGPIRLLVGYTAGGPADTAARIVAERLGTELGQPVVVDNRPGAGGQIAAQALKAAPADGSVLFLSNTHTVVTVPLTVKNPGFATAKDFRIVGGVATFELALAVSPKTNAHNLKELGAWFAAHQSESTIGVPAPASAPELVAAKVSRALKADTVAASYRGAPPMVQDLLAGQLAAGVSSISDFQQYHQAGTLRILAVTRSTPLLPGVPSFAEAGLGGLDNTTDLLGIYAPAATPDAIVARYNTALNRVLSKPDVQARFKSYVMTPAPMTPAEQMQRLAQASVVLSALMSESRFVPQ
ncbi:tripartite tricarboxylate transporter substrate-binding protein [Variovorax atrisoli]|uniref:tripartite tricarboxylate transporter substrate-binding protein n=1 Tax=Variovorax atrisoli TaxID=3394203 RepID=UPI0003AACD1E|nr:tripartite tricarboxylate transporter substrate-binding protein [Variovorax paradoxus]